MDNPLKYFSELQDPRVERTREHLLEEILLMTIAAVLSGAGGWNEIEGYGHAKIEWFKSFLSLPGGIPSHDTFNRVFSALDPEQLEKGFVAWVRSIAQLTADEVVAIDGKALRGTAKPSKKEPVADGLLFYAPQLPHTSSQNRRNEPRRHLLPLKQGADT